MNPVVRRPRGDDPPRFDGPRRRDYPRYYDDPRHRYDRRRHDRRHDQPVIYLPLLFFGGWHFYNYDDRYWTSHLLWEDAVTLYEQEGWVEFVLDCRAYGGVLWLEVRDGRARIDWAEVIFDDGAAQVVDFTDRTLGPGLYRLLEPRGPRFVEYVRMIARATTRDVQLIVRLER